MARRSRSCMPGAWGRRQRAGDPSWIISRWMQKLNLQLETAKNQGAKSELHLNFMETLSGPWHLQKLHPDKACETAPKPHGNALTSPWPLSVGLAKGSLVLLSLRDDIQHTHVLFSDTVRLFRISACAVRDAVRISGGRGSGGG